MPFSYPDNKSRDAWLCGVKISSENTLLAWLLFMCVLLLSLMNPVRFSTLLLWKTLRFPMTSRAMSSLQSLAGNRARNRPGKGINPLPCKKTGEQPEEDGNSGLSPFETEQHNSFNHVNATPPPKKKTCYIS